MSGAARERSLRYQPVADGVDRNRKAFQSADAEQHLIALLPEHHLVGRLVSFGSQDGVSDLALQPFPEDGPNAAVGGITQGLEIESVTATDKWTVEIKLTKPQIDVPWKMLNNYFVVHAPEQIEQYGDAKDWRNLVGTGPFRLTDVVEGSSSTWEKNPNYWGVDEKFGNRLPYIDEYRQLLMPEISTRLAALRTGKVDFMGNEGDGYITSIDDLEALKQTNPEIAVWPSLGAAAGVFWFNQALPITADVNVRKAMQMAVDRETIAATYFRGWGDSSTFWGNRAILARVCLAI